MEFLFAHAYLCLFGFYSMQEYNKYLDNKFLENPNDEILLELEECSSSCKDSFALLKRYFEYETNNFNYYLFGKTLFAGLEKAYENDIYTITQFGRRCYNLWNLLPERVSMDEPFYTLNYADDCLSYGDEKRTRELYEEAFEFYK